MIIDINEIIIPLVIAAKIIAIVTSSADKGAPIISTMLPITFPIKSDDEEWEKACCITCIAIKPGAKNSVKLTPKTPSLLSPIARVITSKNKIAVIIGPITVCPKTFKNLNVSFLYNEYVQNQEVVLTSSSELNSSTINEIENKVRDITSKNITLVNKIDSSIVGGFVLRVGDLQYDASFKNQLNKLKQEFINISIQ